MNTKDFYTQLVADTTQNSLFEALRKLTLLEDPRNAFSGGTAAAPWTAWYSLGSPEPA